MLICISDILFWLSELVRLRECSFDHFEGSEIIAYFQPIQSQVKIIAWYQY